MEQALTVAEHSRGRTSPNPLVGAVIIDEETADATGLPRVLSRGHHVRPGADHAEVAALRPLGGQAPGKTLYVTLEPCNHVGRTGRCTDAILAAGLRRVVVGMRDENPRVQGGGIDRLRAAGIEVTAFVLEDRCRHQNRGFLHWHATGRPHMLLKAALSLDGKLALRSRAATERAPQWLTGAAAQRRAHQLRDRVDAVLVGAGTVLTDDPQLTVRLPADETRDARQPLRVVLDGALRTPVNARLCGPGTLIVTSAAALRDRPESCAGLRERGVEIVALPGVTSHPDAPAYGLELPAVLRALGERNLLYVMCEGGARLHGALLSAELYDEAALFFAPVLLGERGLPLGVGFAPSRLDEAPWLVETQLETLGPDVLFGGLVRQRGFSTQGAKKEEP
jgi:diaminohydroxyphosphoribosylaminopyrimidine deaminase/5-amino-6-(5-phosphoribosylamino)uracil reductase